MNLPDIALCHILCMNNKSVKFILNSIIAEQLLPSSIDAFSKNGPRLFINNFFIYLLENRNNR